VRRDSETVTPLTLLGDSRRRVLAEYVRAAVERWRRTWAGDPKPRVSVEISAAESHTGRWSSQSCFRVESAQATTLYLFVAARCLPVIAGIRGEVPDAADRQPEPGSLAARLEHEAARRLALELLSGARSELASFERTPTGIRQVGLARYALASITLGDAEATFSVALDPGLVASLLPTRASLDHGERVEPRRVAAAEQPVAVEAVLGQTEVSLRELASLTVGDVIVMEESLSDSGTFQIDGGGRVGRVSLGRLDGRRAVQFKGKFQ
jgi:hypothetical protein